MTREYRVGTRASALAMRQTETIMARIQSAFPETRFRVVEIVTHGDRFQDRPIAQMGEAVDRGIFNTALEAAVLSGEVDFATCSFKDVETDLPQGLRAISVLEREDVRDVLVSRHGVDLAGLPKDSVLATSSPRRMSQLRAFRPDFRFQPLRGNVPTRVERESARFDGVVLAAAGLLRLGLQGHIAQWIPDTVLLPAPAQAALGCEFLSGREDVARLIQGIQHPETERCVRLEKAMLVRLSGGCFAPIGVLAREERGRVRLRVRIVSLDASRRVEEEASGAAEDGAALIEILTERIAAQGGLEIVKETREALQAGAA
ncbi:MAG: hydroxymethylbilane synthase [Deltaproteobacteria bacterium]|nr:hydroxymethylbilane synthase [Deltaproteobacteria bacterium]